MITRDRVMLVSSSKGMIGSKLCRYEAVEEVDTVEQVEGVWKRNKVPVIHKALLRRKLIPYKIIQIPEEILYDANPQAFIDFCHDNGFEPGEFITGEKYDTSVDDCFLCRIANYGGSTKTQWVYNKNVQKEADIIVYETDHFIVVSEFGSIMRGFLMICPKEHILSIAEMPDEYFEEYYQVERDIEFILKGTYGKEKNVCFFEHGSSPDGKSSHKRSVVHAHTHVVCNFEFDQRHIDMVCLRPCSDIRELRGGKYFSYQNGTDGQLLAVNDPDVYVQRQFPRQVMGEKMELAPGQYNWRKQGFEENITATLYRIHCFLLRNYYTLPPRIVNNTEGFLKGYAMRENYRKS